MTTEISTLILLIVLLMFSITVAIFVVNSNFKNTNSKIERLADSLKQQSDQIVVLVKERTQNQREMQESITRLMLEQQQEQHKQRSQFDEHQIKNLKLITDSLQSGIAEVRSQIVTFLKSNTDEISKNLEKLTAENNSRLKEISGQVEKRLSEGFEKTTATFTDVVKRLALIDEAQKKMAEISSNIISLQEILNDKRSRGAFGEVQLEALIRNVLPVEHFALQHTLSNGKRVDCILFLPEPTGNIAIDAKFPLESYQLLSDPNVKETERNAAKKQFSLDVRKHIQDIAAKYIISGETADGALMFIPAESIFAEIHAYYPDLVEISHKARVWMVSPTTMMAILTTARAVLKDAATRKQIHIIQQHLVDLSKDFNRFQTRMDNLAKHIHQANSDVEEVHQSSKKISSRFDKIEKVDLEEIKSLE